MLTLNLGLKDKSYNIYIGENLLDDNDIISKYITAKQVIIISNTTVAPLYLNRVKKLLSNYQIYEIILPDGEIHKTMASVESIIATMLKYKINRDATIIALGGGVVGDISGFVASIYQRGIKFIQIPTTLLAQVDSSVGGKTGVNHALGKNMIGSFYQPQCVIIDINTLKTLTKRQFNAGLAEVIKYGLLGDIIFYNYIKNNIDNIINFNCAVIVKIIFTSCQMKANIVSQDEKEQGMRALLNLGHTFGHAIENLFGYGKYLHGEAIAIGILMAAQMSVLEGYINADIISDIKKLFNKFNLPTNMSKIDIDKFITIMKLDKKNVTGDINLILLKNNGHAFISNSYKYNNLIKSIEIFTGR